MVHKEQKELTLSTNIKFIDESGKILHETHNTLTRQGISLLHTLLTTTQRLSHLHTTPTTQPTNIPPQDTANFPTPTLFPITSSYGTNRADGKLILVFTTQIVHTGTIRRLGLGTADNLATVAPCNMIINGAVTVLYQIEIGGLVW